MEPLSQLVLRSIDAYESARAEGPTVEELAAELGIPPMFGHRRLTERLQRQVVLGRVHSDGEHLRLTTAGRLAVSAR